MSKIALHENLSNGKLREIALRLRSRMESLGISATELARRCDALAQATYTNGDCPNLTRERIAKILMNAQPRIGKGAAQVISQTEIRVLADILKVSPEWLANQAAQEMPVFWDIGTDPKFAKQVAHLLTHYEEMTNESLIWGENLLCSLTPPEFAHAYHENYFAEYEAIGLSEQKRMLVEVYDEVGNVRRQNLFDDLTKRSYTVTQIIFLSEFKHIVEGAENYTGISRSLRQRCLKNLAKFVADEKYKINLVIVRDEDAKHLKHLLRDYDRFSVNGDKFAMWAYHSGRLAWSKDKTIIRQNRQILERLIDCAAYRNRRETSAFLLELCGQLEKEKCSL